MSQGRKESTPSEQLWELRKARDRYNALADRLRDGSELALADEKLEREREARRFAAAYEKSIENMIARCRSRQIETDPSTSGSVAIGFALLIFFAAAGGASYFAFAPAVKHQNAPTGAGHAGNAGAPTINKSPDLSAVSLQKPVSDKGARMIPPPISALKPRLGLDKRQNVQPIQTAEHAERSERADNVVRRPVHDASQAGHDEGGFVTKVLQPDGSLMEEYFPAKAPR